MKQSDHEEEIVQAFYIFGGKQTGRITREGLKEAMDVLNPKDEIPTEEELDMMMQIVDPYNNGEVNFAEFQVCYNRLLKDAKAMWLTSQVSWL